MAQAPTELLEQIPLFEGLPRDELERLATSFKERRFSAGDSVAVEGKGGVGFFVISEGTASVDVHGEKRGQLGPGDYFGEVALIDEHARRTATITAETDLTCYGMTAWQFRPFVETNALVAWRLLQVMARRLRETEQQQISI
ncbi:MAG: cyclic nucleotide-binding domain-containing protein [Gaiellaceae bacterium]